LVITVNVWQLSAISTHESVVVEAVVVGAAVVGGAGVVAV